MTRILIIGGYGAFGARAAERLAREPGLEIIIAGRSLARASAFAGILTRTAKAKIKSAVFDAATASAARIAELSPSVVINASGPFQAHDYQLAQACIDARRHYIDLADARAFVTGIAILDPQARAANVCVISGASSVPGLSSAVVQRFAGEFETLQSIEIGISPGNSFDPGEATVASVVGQAGKPFTLRSGGGQKIAYGWQGLGRHRFPEIGARWMSDVDVPDLDLLPAHYPSLATARFVAGLEVPLFHLGLWALSWLVRLGLVASLAPLARPLRRANRSLRFLGSDRGGMFVTMCGRGRDGRERQVRWHLIARQGHGPYIPAIASVVLAKRLALGGAFPAGARACFGLMSLAEFEAEVAGLDIVCTCDQS